MTDAQLAATVIVVRADGRDRGMWWGVRADRRDRRTWLARLPLEVELVW